jgi:ABC-2 type transport system permease protein
MAAPSSTTLLNPTPFNPTLFNPTVAGITLRAALGRRRALLYSVPGVVLIIITALLKAASPPDANWPGGILGELGMTVMLPITALIIGTSVLGAEIDEGSIVHLLATPVRRSAVIGSKFAIATVLTMIFAALPEFLAALIARGGMGKLPLGLLVGALCASVIYSAIFVMLSAVTTRAVIIGLAYVLIWEALLGAYAGGTHLLSAAQYSLGIANSIAHYKSLNASLSLTTSVVMAIIVTAAALVFAVRSLSSFALKGDAA